jgi:hypothetical protein
MRNSAGKDATYLQQCTYHWMAMSSEKLVGNCKVAAEISCHLSACDYTERVSPINSLLKMAKNADME